MILPKTIAVFRALQLGDMLCAVPALRALRTAFPATHIALIGLPWAAGFVQRFSRYLDELILFPGYPGLPEQPPDAAGICTFLASMRRRRFDLLLQMQGNGSIVNPLMHQLGATVTAGFRQPEEQSIPGLFLEYPDTLHEIDRHLALMRYLGIPASGRELEFPYDKRVLLPRLPSPYICVHPGSRNAARQWPPVYFAALADHFAAAGYHIVLTGTEDEMPLAENTAAMMRYSPSNLAGRTTPDGMAALLEGAAALFSNCTGVSHMAAALRTPSVIISMDGEAFRWAPLDKSLHRTIDWTREQDYSVVLQEAENLLGCGGAAARS
ncbi:glycosyltransferase family 9 protein [Chitinophaga lutea]